MPFTIQTEGGRALTKQNINNIRKYKFYPEKRLKILVRPNAITISLCPILDVLQVLMVLGDCRFAAHLLRNIDDVRKSKTGKASG